MSATPGVAVSPDLQALLEGRLHDPFRFLGTHRDGEGWVLRAFLPHAEAVWLRVAGGLQPLARVRDGPSYRRARRVGILVCIELDDARIGRLLARHVAGEGRDLGPQIGLGRGGWS